MKKVVLFLCVLLSVQMQGAGKGEKLDELDAILQKKAFFDAGKEARIDSLRTVYAESEDGRTRYLAASSLWEEYKSYMYDSAYVYANRMREFAAGLGDKDMVLEADCALVFCLQGAGFYKEAFEIAGGMKTAGVSPAMLTEYYRTMASLNNSARNYNQADPYHSVYLEAANEFNGKLMAMLPQGSPEWKAVRAGFLLENGLFEESIGMYRELLLDESLDDHTRAIYSSSLGWMLQIRGKTEEAVEALAESAICDVRGSIKETTALRMLSELLSREGEEDRPIRYVRQSLEDAKFYDARLRIIEIGAVLPIIEQNHADRLSRERNFLLVGILLAVLLAAAATFTVLFIRRQNRRLDEANARLKEADAIKAEYIGNSFYTNAEFIDKMEQLYKMVDRMIVTRQYDELRRSLKESAINKERDAMFDSFDSTFLKIFPTFVNDYNALFPESEQRFPEHGLTPEMRIFALIRLGISESERIAKFLNYSVHTVHTYKTRVKNKSLVDNDRFEAEIMLTGH